MKTNDFRDFLPFLEAARTQKPVLIVTHERPDGDAIGSSTGLLLLLRENGYAAEFYFQDDIPDYYRPFLPDVPVKLTDAKALNERYAFVWNVDASTVKRLGLKPVPFESVTIPILTLDHHPDNEHFGTLSYVDDMAGAAAEIVFLFARSMNWRISAQAATCLLLGLTTDTGGFRFSNTTSRGMRSAADLLDLGADYDKIIHHAYLSKPFNMAMFEAEILCRHLKTAFDGAYVWAILDPAVMKKFSVDSRNTEQFIECLRSIGGVQVAALIKHTSAPGIFKISLRSKNPALSVGTIARSLGGGGHEMAAGASIFAKTVEDAENVLYRRVKNELEKCENQTH